MSIEGSLVTVRRPASSLKLGLLLVLLLAIVVTLGVASPAFAGESFITTQLTHNGIIDGNWTHVSGDRVVWESFDENVPTSREIYTWTPTTGTVRITSDSYLDVLPDVSGDRVVWLSYRGASGCAIFTWTPTGKVQIASGVSEEAMPRVSGDRVVWKDFDAKYNSIFTWTPGGGTKQLTEETDNGNPQISGDRLVWEGFDGSNEQVFTWTEDGGTLPLTADARGNRGPHVSGDRVVWYAGSGVDGEIFTWTPGGGTVQVTKNTSDDRGPVVSGARLVWMGDYEDVGHIYTWTPGTGIYKVTGGSIAPSSFPEISGNRVIWAASDGNDDEIYTWTPSAGLTQVTADTTDEYMPQVSGDRMVWDGLPPNLEVFTAAPKAAVPTVTALSPKNGGLAGGATITVTGSGFTGTSSVRFGSAAATSVTLVSSTKMTCRSPAHSAGTVDVTVTTDGDTSATGPATKFTYLPAPTITAVSPDHGLTGAGTPVTLTGTGLTAATGVSFGGSPATGVLVVSGTTVTCVAPAHAAGRVEVTVTTPGGVSSAAGTANDYYFVTRYQESDVNILYGGSWSAVSDSLSWGSAYKRGNAAGSSAVIRFSGVKLYWLATTGPTMGDASVSVDGQTPAIVHLYSATPGHKKLVWKTGNMATLDHIVQITSSAASGKYISLDAVEVAGTLTPVPAPKTYQETDSNLKYTPAWTPASGPSASGGTYALTNIAGARVVAGFNGVRISILARRAPSYGKISVSIDGGAPAYVDLYSATTVYGTVWYSTYLRPGSHTVTIQRAGQRNAASTGYTVTVDGLVVRGTLEDPLQ